MSENGKETQAKVGVYICHCGGNISDHVDVQKVEDLARQYPGVSVARQNSFMCSDPGQELIIRDIQEGKINRVVVASCAPALHETTFRGAISRAGMNPFLYEHANIREQVSWVHHGEGATVKAAALVGAAVAKARNLEPLEPIRVPAKGHATVIGGGPAGLKAARDLAAQGIEVTLLEKTPFLGGNAAGLDRLFPTGDRAADIIGDLAAQVLADPAITVITCAEVTGAGGYVGNFNLQVKRRPPQAEDQERLAAAQRAQAQENGFIPLVGVLPDDPPAQEEDLEIETGAIILATGFKHYTPSRGEYGFGLHPRVVTLPDLIKLTAGEQAGGQLMVDGKPVRSVAMIHCVGSRHIPGLVEPAEEGRPLNEHCSRVCCTATLQTALELKEKYPELEIYDLYRDIRTYGRGHEDYYLDASSKGVRFIRFRPESLPQVDTAGEQLKVTVADTLLGGLELELEVDLVVLAVGMEPGGVGNLVEMLKLSLGADRFLLEVHPKLRPVEPAINGVYLAGTCQAPMDVSEAAAAAGAAAVKAGALLGRGYVELEPFVAQVDTQKCVGSGACQEVCLREGAIEMVEAEGGKKAQVNPALCIGCGVCVAACEQGAIQVAGWTLPQYEAMVDALTGQNAPAEDGQ